MQGYLESLIFFDSSAVCANVKPCHFNGEPYLAMSCLVASLYSSVCFRKISTALIAMGLSQKTGTRGAWPDSISSLSMKRNFCVRSTANAGTTTPPDLKEFYHFGRESWPQEPYYTGAEGRRYFIPNFWPARPQRFADAAAAYYAEMEKLAALMMQLTALALGLDEHFFDAKIEALMTSVGAYLDKRLKTGRATTAA